MLFCVDAAVKAEPDKLIKRLQLYDVYYKDYP